jgi:hypothetical protein
MVGPADNPFKGLATAVGAINVRFFIGAHEELFENAATLKTSKLKDWHSDSPENKVSLILMDGIDVQYRRFQGCSQTWFWTDPTP